MRTRILLATLLGALTWWPATASADCSLTSVGITALSDQVGSYQGFAGGLYPGGYSTRPPAHEADAIAIANEVTPLDANGDPDPSGKIVFISIGMSNTRSAFDGFLDLSNPDPARNPSVLVVNGAQDSRTAEDWMSSTSFTWNVLDSRISSAGGTPAQVQVAWIKVADRFPDDNGAFPAHAELLQDRIEEIIRSLKVRYPNVRLAYLSSRTRAYTDDASSLNPEPFAHETAYSVRWAIESQLAGDPELNYDPADGTVTAPLMSWGPYLWIDGLDTRSDGLQWLCSDVISSDFTHPSNNGKAKVGAQLQTFFKADPTTTPWYLRSNAAGPPSCDVAANTLSGPTPLQVDFDAGSADSNGSVIEHAWTFGDGTGSGDADPTKVFHLADDYTATLTVTDDDGNTALCAVAIQAPEPAMALLACSALGAIGLLAADRRRRKAE